MYQAAQLAVREEPGSSPFRASALAYLGLATLIRGDDEAADALFAEASEVGERIGGMNAASLAFAERSLIATSRGDRDAADEYARLARAVVHDAHLDEHITTGPVYAASARAALRAGDQEQARVELSAAQRLRPILTWGFPTISVQTRLELARVHVGLSDVPGARTLLAEVDEILTHRPDLGTLTTQAVELRTHVGSVRTGRSPGSDDPDGRGAPPPHVPAHAPVVPRDRRSPVRLAEHRQDPGDLDLPQARRVRAFGCGPGRPRPPPARAVVLGRRSRLSSRRDDARACGPRWNDGPSSEGTTADGQARGRAPMHGARRRAVRQGRPGDAAHRTSTRRVSTRRPTRSCGSGR